MNRLRILAVSAVALATAAMAQSAAAWPGNPSGTQDYLVPYIGAYRIFQKEGAGQLGVEYRFHQWDFGVRPTFGANVDNHGDTYAYGGINWEIPLMQSQLLLIPNFMAGYYHHSAGKDLGGPVEFRSGIELDYQLPNTQRIGVAFNHISNASIYSHNPGAQTLLVNYSIPVGVLAW